MKGAESGKGGGEEEGRYGELGTGREKGRKQNGGRNQDG